MRAARRGFLSGANWHSARHSLPPNTQTYIGQSSADLIAKVKSGEIVRAMIKGVPLDPEGELLTFPSTTITPQAVFFKPGGESESMQEAVDAALVRMLAAGKAQEARQNNPPNICAQPKLTALAAQQRLIRAPRVAARRHRDPHVQVTGGPPRQLPVPAGCRRARRRGQRAEGRAGNARAEGYGIRGLGALDRLRARVRVRNGRQPDADLHRHCHRHRRYAGLRCCLRVGGRRAGSLLPGRLHALRDAGLVQRHGRLLPVWRLVGPDNALLRVPGQLYDVHGRRQL